MPPQSDHSDEKAQTTASSASDRGALVSCFLGVCFRVFVFVVFFACGGMAVRGVAGVS